MGVRLARRGYSLAATSVSATQIELELYIYTGVITTDQPVDPTVVLFASMIPKIGSTNNYADINIGRYIMDYMETKFNDFSSEDKGVWCGTRYRVYTSGTPGSWTSISTYAYTPGYGVFGKLQDWNVENQNAVLIEQGTTIYVPIGERLKIPALDYSPVAFDGYFYNGTTFTDIVTTPGSATDTNAIISYVEEPIALDTTGLYRDNGVLDNILTHKIERVDARDGEARKIIFINQSGALQEMWFFGRRKGSFKTEGITSRRDTKWYTADPQERHQYTDFLKNGRESFILNSGWQVEANNVFFKDLLMSEQIWINEEYILGSPSKSNFPIRVTSSSMDIKSERWDKMINYAIEFEYAFDYATV